MGESRYASAGGPAVDFPQAGNIFLDCEWLTRFNRQELVAWLNNLLQLNITKVEQCGTGYVAPHCLVGLHEVEAYR